MSTSETIRYLGNEDDGRQKFLLELPGYENGLVVTAGWTNDQRFEIPANADSQAVAADAAGRIAGSVVVGIRPWLPATVEGYSKGDLHDQAGRIGVLFARWYYDCLEPAIRYAAAEAAELNSSRNADPTKPATSAS